MARVRVIGVGNPDAGDDAVGLLAARAVADRLEGLADVEVIEAGIGPRVVDLLREPGLEVAIVIDAVRTPGARRMPGSLIRTEVGLDGQPLEVGSAISSHGFGVAESVGLAAALGSPTRVIVHGVEAGEVRIGAPLHPSVRCALRPLVDAVVVDVEGALG
ncbi:MAG TPA: hydrogenase maturation protease [Actinomycetota bacterium]|nr:hydrogenase maturation protease [Actinomycetota bacterium]